MLRRFIIYFGLLCLPACGFHLRGPVQLPAPLQRVYVETQDPYGELSRDIRLYLKEAGVVVTDAPQKATSILQIVSEIPSQQLLSVGGTQQTRQYNLVLTVVFAVTTPAGKPLIPPQTVTEIQALTVQADQVLGGSNEENNLYHQMRTAIVYTMMNRLASKAARASVMNPNPS